MFLVKQLTNYNSRAISRQLTFPRRQLISKGFSLYSVVFTEMEDIATMFQNAEELASFGRREEAMNRYSQFIDLVECKLKVLPNEPVKFKLQEQIALAYNNRGHLRYLNVDFPEAVSDYTKGLDHTQLPVTYYNRGLIHYRLGYFDEAIRDMQEALNLDPNFESAKHCLHQSTEDKNVHNNHELIDERTHSNFS
ncbi:tetratricopeptide repeat protein 32 [Octopus sinensis]|uniref:Tetratricopeptide repeat protein 32 n=1 Tax=Octopus sinensis TaxID=2607531 RepID=A0A6P7SR70_9MOLL|nr:tetratricopeptide repeat protein 32 [Octopus sinensis]